MFPETLEAYDGADVCVRVVSGRRVLVSAADVHLLDNFRWCVGGGKGPKYVRRNIYPVIDGRYRCITTLLHRVIMKPDDHQKVDHINGDSLDNRRENLRICSHAENLWNARSRKAGASGVSGVQKERNKYKVVVYRNRERHYIGTFKTVEEATSAHRAAVERLHGEYSRFS